MLELFHHPRLFDVLARAWRCPIAARSPRGASPRWSASVQRSILAVICSTGSPRSCVYRSQHGPGALRLRSRVAPPADALFGRVFKPDLQRPVGEQRSARQVRGVLHPVCHRPLRARTGAGRGAGPASMRRAGHRPGQAQHCCGLPHLDSGDRPGARRLAQQTIAGLESVKADYVVTAAASCAVAILHDYAHLLEDDPAWSARAQTRSPSARWTSCSFIDRVASPPPLPPAPADGRAGVTYHSFCQSTNVLGIADARPAAPATGRSSADGPTGSDGLLWLRRRRLDRLSGGRARASSAANWTTSVHGCIAPVHRQPGCLLHLRGAAHAAGDDLEVRHIVELLAERPRSRDQRLM